MTDPEEAALPIHDMASRHPGLTQAIADHYLEAARICLDRHHQPPINFDVEYDGDHETAETDWQPTDQQVRNAWANEIEATEAGACACALAAAELAMGMVAVHRAEQGDGADYYIAPNDQRRNDRAFWHRLEISGIGADIDARGPIDQRVRDKLAQLTKGSDPRPGTAGIVAFKAKIIRLANEEAS